MLGEALKCIRIAHGNLTFNECAKGVGVTGTYISEIEKGRRNPSLATLKDLSSFYEIPLSVIMELDEFNDTCDDLSYQKTLLKALEYYIQNSEQPKDSSKSEDTKRLGKVLK